MFFFPLFRFLHIKDFLFFIFQAENVDQNFIMNLLVRRKKSHRAFLLMYVYLGTRHTNVFFL